MRRSRMSSCHPAMWATPIPMSLQAHRRRPRSGNLVVDFLGPNEPRRDDRGEAHAGQEVEDPLIGDVIADHHRQHGRADIPRVVERLVAAGPPWQVGVAHQAEGDRRDRRPKNRRRRPHEHLRRQDRRERRPQDHRDGAERHGGRRRRDRQPLVPRPVDERAGRRLRGHRRDPHCRHRDPDPAWVPVPHRQVDRQVRPQAVPHVGQEHVQCVECPQAHRRCWALRAIHRFQAPRSGRAPGTSRCRGHRQSKAYAWLKIRRFPRVFPAFFAPGRGNPGTFPPSRRDDLAQDPVGLAH